MAKKLTKWRPHEVAENVLDSHGIEWEYSTVYAGEIDITESRQNRSRFGSPLNRELVDDYAAAMEQGDVFPAIVIRSEGYGRHVIVGGNHRHAAAIKVNPDNKFYCIVITCNDLDFDILCSELNAVEGSGLDRKDRLNHAVEMVNKHGVAIKEAAQIMRLTHHALRDALAADHSRSKVADAGVNPGMFNNSILRKLKKTSQNPPVFVPLVKAMADARASTGEMDKLISDVNAQPIEEKKKELINEWTKVQRKTGAKKRVVRTPIKRTVLLGIGSMESALLSCKTSTQTQMSDDELSDVLNRLNSIRQHVAHLLANGTPPHGG